MYNLAFSIVSPGRTGSTILSKILQCDKDLIGINELIEPIESNLFLSRNHEVNSALEYWSLISQARPQYILDLWSRIPNKEVLYLSKSKLPSTLFSYCLPIIYKDLKENEDNIKENIINFLSTNQNRNTAAEYFKTFLKYMQTISNSETCFERTGGGSRMIREISHIFNGRVVLSMRRCDSLISSMSKHSVFILYANIIAKKQNKSHFSSDEKTILLLIYLLKPLEEYIRRGESILCLIDYNKFTENPEVVMNSFYHKVLNRSLPNNAPEYLSIIHKSQKNPAINYEALDNYEELKSIIDYIYAESIIA